MAITIPTDWQDRGSQYFSPSTKSTKSKAGSYCDITCVQLNGDCTNTNYVSGNMVISINSLGTDCTVKTQAVYAVRYRILQAEFTSANLTALAGAINTDVFAAGDPCA